MPVTIHTTEIIIGKKPNNFIKGFVESDIFDLYIVPLNIHVGHTSYT